MQNSRRIYAALLCLSVVLWIGACKQQAQQTETTAPAKQTLPPPTNDYMVNLFDNCDYIDIIFHNFDFSMSVSDKANAQGNVTYMSLNPVDDIACTPSIGRAYYSGGGDELCVADIHYSEACAYYVLLKNNRPHSACQMSEKGIAFMKQVLSMRVQPQK